MKRALAERPTWDYSSPRPLVQAYGNVEIHGSHVIGTWFCVDLATGRELWNVRHDEANNLRLVGPDVVVASETKSDGPWTADFGIVVFDRRTGDELWRSEGASLWQFLVSLLPGRKLRGVGTPRALVGSEVHTSEGERRDARTGEHLGWLDEDANPEEEGAQSHDPAWLLYLGESIALPDGDRLHSESDRGDLELSRTGKQTWRFELSREDLHVQGNFYSWRYVGDAVLILASSAPVAGVDAKAGWAPNDVSYELLLLDVVTGEVVQRFTLTSTPGPPCRIEDVDESIVLFSQGQRLWCHAWERR